MTKLNSSFMIGNVEIPHRTVLAPMAGVTNSAFRTIAKEFGAGLVVMEMISEKGLLYNNEKTLHMLHIDENEHPMSIQLFGGDAEGLKRAADFIQTNTKADNNETVSETDSISEKILLQKLSEAFSSL